MTAFDFDEAPERANTDSVKWTAYPDDVLPLWVADMDFRAPEPAIEALRRRVQHGVFGYGKDSLALAEAVVERLGRLYGWKVAPPEIVFLPGVVPGLHHGCSALLRRSERMLIQTPIYPPIRKLPLELEVERDEVGFLPEADGWAVDWEAFDDALRRLPRVFVLCNPQNPLGRVFRQEELVRMAEACLRAGVTIVSDEIHSDLVFPPARHLPIASLDAEISRRTITLMAPSKTFNLAGLQCAFAVVPDQALRARLRTARTGILAHVNLLGFVAAEAAYRYGEEWLAALLVYLQSNRDLVMSSLKELPGISAHLVEGTHLAWLDCRQSRAGRQPYRFFLDRAKVALSDGALFGREGDGFVRLNFGCTRKVLMEALARMKRALCEGPEPADDAGPAAD